MLSWVTKVYSTSSIGMRISFLFLLFFLFFSFFLGGRGRRFFVTEFKVFKIKCPNPITTIHINT